MNNRLKTILKLEIIGDIGGEEGKNSDIKLARDHQLGADLAVKIIPKEKFIKDFGTGSENMFFTEAKMIYANQHPNIVKIQYASSCTNNIYYTMPFYKNGSLNKLIDRRYLKVREIIKYSLEFLSGIHYIHTNNLYHFDIKPTNVLINDNGKAMLTDFGLSRYTDNYGVAKYSQFYLSHFPAECIGTDVATKHADIYQAGLTIYRMCNGNNCFHRQYDFWKEQKKLNFAIKEEKFPKREYLPHIPSKLRRIINKALRSDPDRRYQTILGMMNDISKIEKNLDTRFYRKDDNNWIWEQDNLNRTHYDKISIIVDGNDIITKGQKVRLSDNKTTNINCLDKSGHNNIKEAFRFVEKYINN